ncbi:MAG: tRNA (adenosine(37)-N6)-threonylcarbamoyltransferase complex ATPase subunit type 1 TsaE [Legionella sp. 21-45-4]|nr:MAG: tRNA (adenosine(37)-N6)-threonylcarbamoyltransferase complex ATPase subunit type 1 TsaE [Legionella sp. 21-45-4]
MTQVSISLVLADEAETSCLAKRLASAIQIPLNLSFKGDLGTGKTTLIRALLRQLGVLGPIKSPTYSLVESYPVLNNQWAHHFDLYRVTDESELDAMGFRDFFAFNTLCCIEWPEHAPSLHNQIDIVFSLSHLDAGRLLNMTAMTPVGDRILHHLSRAT